MSDVVTSARSARERLAQGLGALQGPGVPEHLMSVAEPIARAMSALHRVEMTSGQAVRESGPMALEAVRTALGMLQAQTVNHPSVDAALEAVAGSLGLVHRLVQAAGAAQPSPVQPAATAAAAPAPAAQAYNPPPGVGAAPFAATELAAGPGRYGAAAPAAQGHGAMHVHPAQARQSAAQPAPHHSPAQHQPMVAPTSPAVGLPYRAAPSAPGIDSSFAPNSTLQSQGAERPPPGAAAAAYGVGDTQPEAKPIAAAGAAAAPVPSQMRLEAALGAHSATNFYKGLSGNDVVDAGGIFIATYQIPRIGTPLLLRISLPGGYEFDAQAVVRWTREPSSGSDGSSPGFGAQFTAISPEGRQLVYRYVRNREPLFHDDL